MLASITGKSTTMAFNIFNHKKMNRDEKTCAQRNIITKISDKQNAGWKFFNSQRIACTWYRFFSSFYSLTSNALVVNFYVQGERKREMYTYRIMVTAHGLRRYLEKIPLLSQFLLEHKKENFYFDVNVCRWQNKQSCWRFVLNAGRYLPLWRKLYYLLFLSFFSLSQSSDNERKKKEIITLSIVVTFARKTINASWWV